VIGTTGYQIWLHNYTTGIGGPTNFTPAQAGCDVTTICNFTLPTPLITGNNYGWAVAAQNAAGQGPWSTGLNFATVSLLPAPSAITPQGGGILPATVFTFNAVAGATGYQIWLHDYTTGIGGPINFTPTQAGCDVGTTCSFTTATPLTAGDGYGWAVAAQNAAGQGPWSNGLNFFVGTPLPAPTQTAPQGTGIATSAAFTFNAVAGATGYQIWLHDYTTGIGGPINFTPAQAGCDVGTACSFTPATPLTATDSYGWAVATQNAVGQGPWSTGLNFVVQ